MKKIISVLLGLCFTFAFVCGCNENDSSSYSSKETVELVLSQSKKELTIGDEYGLKIYSEAHSGQTIAWTSSNPSVASIKNGIITANKAGETTITVTAQDGSTATCEIVVGTQGKLPVLEFEFNYESEIQVSVLEKLNFEGFVKFNDRIFTDATLSYSSSNQAVGTCENGAFTPISAGETVVTVKAEWREVQSEFLTKTFTVTVR